MGNTDFICIKYFAAYLLCVLYKWFWTGMLLNLQAAQTLDIVAIVVGPKSIFKKMFGKYLFSTSAMNAVVFEWWTVDYTV